MDEALSEKVLNNSFAAKAQGSRFDCHVKLEMLPVRLVNPPENTPWSASVLRYFWRRKVIDTLHPSG